MRTGNLACAAVIVVLIGLIGRDLRQLAGRAVRVRPGTETVSVQTVSAESVAVEPEPREQTRAFEVPRPALAPGSLHGTFAATAGNVARWSGARPWVAEPVNETGSSVLWIP